LSSHSGRGDVKKIPSCPTKEWRKCLAQQHRAKKYAKDSGTDKKKNWRSEVKKKSLFPITEKSFANGGLGDVVAVG